jgi:hypothetical protein
MTTNLYFQLTEELNAQGRIAILASGQAVVYYRLAIMSKDGDWILRETEDACRQALNVLERHGARYRAGAPLDPRWLAGGWSSHFELKDERGRRIRCDFFSRPPRVPLQSLGKLFEAPRPQESFPVVDVESLIRMKQTQRAKDYPVIGELAKLLPPEEELAFTTDPDRILDLAPAHGFDSQREAVILARSGQDRLAVVQALAAEIDRFQQEDRRRVERYQQASEKYLRAFKKIDRELLQLPDSHERLCQLANQLLPQSVQEPPDADAER